MFRTKVVEKIKTLIVCSIIFFFENCVIYEILWETAVELEKPQATIWSTRNIYLIPKVTNTYSEYVIFVAVPLQQWLYERASLLRYTHIACRVTNSL